MRIFIICPVRYCTEAEKLSIDEYVTQLELKGHNVHWPLRDTPQNMQTPGIATCLTNAAALLVADEIHIWWNPQSQGSYFDVGMAFALNKPLEIINAIGPHPPNSFENVILNWPWKGVQ